MGSKICIREMLADLVNLVHVVNAYKTSSLTKPSCARRSSVAQTFIGTNHSVVPNRYCSIEDQEMNFYL